MKTYTITLTISMEAENEDEALDNFLRSIPNELNTGENIEIEEE